MTPAKINAIIATSYNIHIGPVQRGEAMTPDKAAKLPRGDRAMLCKVLRDKGGSDLYTQEQAAEALSAIIERRA